MLSLFKNIVRYYNSTLFTKIPFYETKRYLFTHAASKLFSVNLHIAG